MWALEPPARYHAPVVQVRVKLIKKHKDDDWKIFCSNINSIKDTARINKALRCKQTNSLGSLLKDDNTFTTNPTDTLKFLTESLSTQTSPAEDDTKPTDRNLDMSDIDKFINQDRLHQAVKLLPLDKTPGHDAISNKMIVEAWDIISDDIMNIFKCSINLCYVPKAWQLSNSAIIPKPGKSDYSIPKAFRVITLSSSILKLLERLVLWHMQVDLKIEDTQSKHQYGFKKGSSTEAAILRLVNTIETVLKNGNVALGIFLDIEGVMYSKA